MNYLEKWLMHALVSPSPSRGRWGRFWVCLLLGIHGGLLGWGAVRQSPVIDEPVHLTSGLRRLQEGRFDLNRGNPPLVGNLAALPVLLAHPRVDWRSAPHGHVVSGDFIAANGSRSFWLITLGRMACIPLSILAGFVCFRWAYELYGAASGFLALTLWCFCPNAIAHGQLISGDMAATALGVTAFYAYWRWLQRPSLARSVIAGAALGFAELAKYVWVLLYLLWPVLWILWRFLPPRRTARPSWWTEAGYGLLIAALSIYIINLGYLFDAPFRPFGRFLIGRKVLEQLPVGPRIAAWAAAVPVPLPSNYVAGIDEIQQVRESRPSSYLCGEWRRGGWWYYYLCALVLKLPLGTLGLVALACGASLAGGYARDWKTDSLMLLAMVGTVCFAMCSNLPQFFRYILPVLPFGIVWASKVGQAFSRGHRVTIVLAAACGTWSVLSSLLVYPHSLSYFNELAGGPAHGHAYLADSNIDWGQDLLYLRAWLARHPEAKPLHLAYFGCVDPHLAGIEYSPPLSASDPGAPAGFRPVPGWHAVSVSLLRGLRWSIPDGKGSTQQVPGSEYRHFLRLRPAGMAGYSIYIYYVTPERQIVSAGWTPSALPGATPRPCSPSWGPLPREDTSPCTSADSIRSSGTGKTTRQGDSAFPPLEADHDA